LPTDGLSEADINKKSTSDKRKRRIARVAKFPLPVIRKHEIPKILASGEVKTRPQKKKAKFPLPVLRKHEIPIVLASGVVDNRPQKKKVCIQLIFITIKHV